MEKGFTPVFYLWVVTAFMVTRTVVMPTIGWVSAVAGSRTFYLVELLISISLRFQWHPLWPLLEPVIFSLFVLSM